MPHRDAKEGLNRRMRPDFLRDMQVGTNIIAKFSCKLRAKRLGLTKILVTKLT